MSGAARRRGAWRAGAGVLLGWLIGTGGVAAQPDRQLVRIGQVTAIAASADLDLAVALAERADQPQEWFGLGRRDAGPLAILVVRGRSGFDSVARGRLPSWGAGLAMPEARVIAIRADAGNPFQILRHELAHLVLHSSIRGRVPRWFDEGYAAVASGEFGRLASLEVNVGVAFGPVPTIDELNAGLRGSEATAGTAYGLAATAVLFLARGHPTGTLTPLFDHLAAGVPFDSAVGLTTGLAPGRFEDAWRRDVKRRHGIVLWLLAGGMWTVLGAAVVVAWRVRYRRDAGRRAALDVGWSVPADGETSGEVQNETAEDRST